MTPPTPPTVDALRDDPGLATVIPLSPRPPEIARPVSILERRVGRGWEALPGAVGRGALRGEELLGQMPAAVDAYVTSAGVAVARGRRLRACAQITLDLLADELVVLCEALGADLETLDLAQVDALAAAIVELSTAPSPSPAWGRPAAAEGAEVVLELVRPVLRDAVGAHERLYERFTEHVWDIPAPLLSAATHRWRAVSRARLALRLRRTSRTGTRPGRITALAHEIIEVRGMRARIAPLRPLLAHHLGALDRGVFTDVDAATEALAAVRRLQASVAPVLDEDRLERLLLADAFRSHELLGPAQSIRTTLAAWLADVGAAGGTGALAIDARALADWSDGIERPLDQLAEGIDALEHLGVVGTLQEAVDALVLREHVADQLGTAPVSEPADASAEVSDPEPRWSVS